MAEVFYPDQFLKRTFPKSFYTQQLVNRGFNLKNTAKRYLQKAYVVAGRELEVTIDNVLDQYAAKAIDLRAESKRGFFAKAVNDDNLLRTRIENVVIQSQVGELIKEHEDEWYEWLPSDAEEPDPEHQLLYGQIFRVGEGDAEGNMPGQRFGCRCGIRWLGTNKRA